MALVNLPINALPINSVKWPIRPLIPTQHPTDMVPVTDSLNIGPSQEIRKSWLAKILDMVLVVKVLAYVGKEVHWESPKEHGHTESLATM